MTKNIIKYVLLALTATFCVSAKQAGDQEELAMARCSRDRNAHTEEGYPDFGRPYHEEGRGCGDDRRYPEERRYYQEDDHRHNRRDRRYYEDDRRDRRYEESHCGPKCCPKQRCCNQRYCFPDTSGNAGYTLDSAGRRRCLPGSQREYKINSQTNCDARGNCQEFTKSDVINPQEVTIKRKSAAQKVLEGY